MKNIIPALIDLLYAVAGATLIVVSVSYLAGAWK